MNKLKKIMIGSFLAACLLHPAAGSAQMDTNSSFGYDVTHDQKTDYKIEVTGWAQGIKPTLSVDRYQNATYNHYLYKKGSHTFHMTFVELKNGDVMYFARNDPSPTANQVTLKITAYDQPITTIIPSTSGWKHVQRSSSIPSSLYVNGERLSYRIGKADAYKPLGYTTLDEYASKEKPILLSKNSNSYTYLISMPSSYYLTDTWGILGSHPLINWNDHDAVVRAYENEFECNKRLEVDGAYYPTPDQTYEPYTPTSFYRNPANGEGLNSLDFLSLSNGSVFMDIATHLAYSAAKNQNPYGYWQTYPRSKGWLYKDYKIGFEYMDNRRNADNATFLLRYEKQTNDPAVLSALHKWDQYFMDYCDKYNVPTGRNGILIPDYVDRKGHVSHTSLNHDVANMNELYEAYLWDKDPKKKARADKMLAGIIETKTRWVMPNHNLYYSLSRSLKPMSSNDYFQLTRDDLLQAQYLLEKIYGSKNSSLQFLIDEKNKWIANQLHTR